MYKDDGQANSQDADVILELEIEKLQKNNDSEFYLDDDFYDRMANEYIESQKPKVPVDLSAIEVDDHDLKMRVETDEEEEDDESYNPLAMTSDGKKGKGLGNELARLVASGNLGQSSPQSDQQEESKNVERPRRDNSGSVIENEDLEIRIDQNAPPVKRRISFKKFDEESDNEQPQPSPQQPGNQSYRDIDREQIELINKELEGENRATNYLKRAKSIT